MTTETSINQKIARGAAWMIAARLMDRSIGLVSTLILARLLVPADFGLVAMATSMAAILDLFGAFGLNLALIQKQNAERRHYDTVWTFNVLFGAFCSITLLALSIPAASFYNEPRLTEVIVILSIAYFIGGFSNIGVVDFQKNLTFHKEFILMFICRIISFSITISCAFYFRSYWALIIGMVSGKSISVIVSYYMHAYRPSFSLAAWRELIHFSKWILINNFLFFAVHRGADLVIGRIHGAKALGIYSLAYEISTLPSTELVAPINRAAFPGFSKLADKQAIANAYLKMFGLISLTILPMGIGIAAAAEPLVKTLLGPNWLEAIPLIQLLAIYGAIAATQTNNGSVCLALGHPRLTTVSAIAFLLVLLPSLAFFTHYYGLVGAGYAFILAQVSNIPIGLIILKRLIPLSWIELIRKICRPVIGVVIMYSLVQYSILLSSNYPTFVTLLIAITAGILSYCCVILVLWLIAGKPDSAESYIINTVKTNISTRFKTKTTE